MEALAPQSPQTDGHLVPVEGAPPWLLLVECTLSRAIDYLKLASPHLPSSLTWNDFFNRLTTSSSMVFELPPMQALVILTDCLPGSSATIHVASKGPPAHPEWADRFSSLLSVIGKAYPIIRAVIPVHMGNVVRYAEEAGFTVDGIVRGSDEWNGKLRDAVLMSFVRSEEE